MVVPIQNVETFEFGTLVCEREHNLPVWTRGCALRCCQFGMAGICCGATDRVVHAAASSQFRWNV